MKQFIAFTIIFLLSINILAAQTNVRGWYAQGQVWIVWETLPDDSSVYEIYESDNSFTSVSNEKLIGRLFFNEWKAGALRDQVKRPLQNINFKIPTPDSTYRLFRNEGLFVKTPHGPGRKYYAVVKMGQTTVTAANITPNDIRQRYLPDKDPVQCHAQYEDTLREGFKIRYYYMWADGRQDYWNSRPDFPVMANKYKNGMPSLFLISEAIGMDTTAGKKIPATLWLHGGGGGATGSIATSRKEINIEPKQGILVAHNDDCFRLKSISSNNGQIKDSVLGFQTNTWFFGYTKNDNPFDSAYEPAAGDTIINYTQRRLIWINDWLIKNYNVDPNRISVNGHSMGSAGTTALMKAYPEKFASATIFNNGLAGPDEIDEDDSQGARLFGTPDLNLCTNLIRRGPTDTVVHIYQAFNLNDRNATARDLPLVRMYHGKNDDKGVMRWDSYVVQEYKKADSLGWGMQLFWSERKHGLESWKPAHDHWGYGLTADSQTVRDNVSYQEFYRSDTSYPGFFNHRLDNKNHDPGDGTVGTDRNPQTDSSGGNYDGHDWGHRGGFHEWALDTIVDEVDRWQVTAWLTSAAAFTNDKSPHEFLKADVSIRRPQRFNPVTGTPLNWYVIDALTADTLQVGCDTVTYDNLVVIPGVTVYREAIRKVNIVVTDPLAALPTVPAAEPAPKQPPGIGRTLKDDLLTNTRLEQSFPNPFVSSACIRYHIPPDVKTAQLIIRDIMGRPVKQINLNAGSGIVYIERSTLASGTYIYSLLADGRLIQSKRMIVAP
jgi:predicted esterase